jgi:hypothetical protein
MSPSTPFSIVEFQGGTAEPWWVPMKSFLFEFLANTIAGVELVLMHVHPCSIMNLSECSTKLCTAFARLYSTYTW